MTYAETLAANRAKILAREIIRTGSANLETNLAKIAVRRTTLEAIRQASQATLTALSPQKRKLLEMRQAQRRNAAKAAGNPKTT